MIYKTCPEGSGPHTSAHAEVRVIRKARAILKTNNLSGYSIYVCRINEKGEMRLSKPCRDCQRLIDKHNLSVQWSVN